MVTVTGKGNYTGTVEKTFTIACRELPSGKNLTDYVDVSPSPNADGWYPSDITLTPKDGCSVGETFTGIGDSVVITGDRGNKGGRRDRDCLYQRRRREYLPDGIYL